MRVWAPGKNSWGPGLALSRAFGDRASRYTYKLVSQILQHFRLIPNSNF